MNLWINIILWTAYLLSLYFSVFLLLVYLDKKQFLKGEDRGQQLDHFPFVSVLVPAYNEEKTILKTLQSIDSLDYPQEKIEAIVINDGSKDSTKLVVEQFIKDKPNFKLLSHPNQGKAASLNRALKIAKGEFFACLDADSFVEACTLKKMLALYYKENDPDLAIITPAMKVYSPKNILQKIQWLEYLVMILFGRLSSTLHSLYVAPGPFSIYNTEIIRKIGGFDEKNITEDQEIAYRIQAHQYKIKQCFTGYVFTAAPGKLKPFYKQRRRWYLGSIICLHQYRTLIANKKYGDFGLMQMVKNSTGYALAVAGIVIALYFVFLPVAKFIQRMAAIDFDFWNYIANYKINISIFSVLTADFLLVFLVILLFVTGFIFFYAAHRSAQEKITRFGWLPLFPYFFFYYLLKGTILLISVAQFSVGKKIRW